MAGPWEDYQATTSPGAGLWQDFSPQQAPPAVASPTQAQQPEGPWNEFQSQAAPDTSEGPSALDFLGEFGKRFVTGGVEGTVATPLRGFGARGETEQSRELETAISMAQSGVGPGEAPIVPREARPVAGTPLYRAGEAVSKATRETLPDKNLLNPVVGDVAGALGSVAGNITTGILPGIGPALLAGSAAGQGMGEAAERAVKAGATPEQQARATQIGTLSGMTEFADMLLASTGSTGKALSLIKRVGLRVLEGIAIEGGQEGLQEAIQNMIAKGVYKPDQAILTPSVAYNAFIGAIAGGLVSGTVGGLGKKELPPPATQGDVAEFGGVLRGDGTPVLPQMPQQPVGPEPAPGAPQDMANPTVNNWFNHLPEPTTIDPTGDVKQAVDSLQATPTGVDPNAPAAQDVQSQPGVNAVRLAKLLGSKLYGSPQNMTSVSVKEMVQNSFDAIKGLIEKGQMKDGRIDIEMNPADRTIAMTDDGSGMSPEVLGKQFLQIAGTKKESKRASGGLGIAKMMFLFENKSLKVTTMRDGKVSEMVTSGDQLRSALEDPSQSPFVKTRTPTADDRKMFPKGHGTRVVAKVPDSFKDPSTGEVKDIPFYRSREVHPVLMRSPLFDNIDVRLNGQPVPDMGVLFPKDAFTQFTNVKFDWGTSRVYVSKEKLPSASYGENVHVLSNGLWQFSFSLPKDPAKPYGPMIPHTFFVDVSPQVDAEDTGYPFDLNRQQFSPRSKDDFKKIFRYIGLVYQAQSFQDEVKNFGHMEYLTFGATGKVERSERFKVEPKVPPRETAFNIRSGDAIEVVDGKLIVRGKEVPELTPEQLDSFQIDFGALKIDQSEIDPNRVIVHDNVDVQVSGPINPSPDYVPLTGAYAAMVQEAFGVNEPSNEPFEVRSMVELGREKFGARFDSYLYQIGNYFGVLRNAVATVMGYGEMKKEGIGISFDVKYRGVSIRVPFAGFFINPAATEYTDTDRAAYGMVGTMIHELAHHQVRDHDAKFPAEMQRILIMLKTGAASGMKFSLAQFEERFLAVVRANSDIQEHMMGVLNGSVGPVSARGKRFGGDGDEQARDGVGSGGVAAPGTGPGSGPDLSERSAGGPAAASPEPRSANVSLRTEAGSESDNGLSANQSAYQAVGTGATPAVPIQPVTRGTRKVLNALFSGNVPAPVRAAAGHADAINKFYAWMAGLDQLVQLNPRHVPLIQYQGEVKKSHLEEADLQDAALRVAKDWRRLGPEADQLAGFLNELTNMSYLSPQERNLGIGRHPSNQELDVLQRKWKLSQEGLKVATKIKTMVEGFLTLVEQNAVASAQRTIQPNKLAARLQAITDQGRALRSRPYFPFMRFGSHYLFVKDPSGSLVHFETFERQGLKHGFRSPESQQDRRRQDMTTFFEQQYGRAPNLGEVVSGVLPESAGPLVGMPSLLLEEMANVMALNPEQLTALNMLTLANSVGLRPILAPRFQRRYFAPGFGTIVPGYSMDLQRSFAKYFFHGSKFYTKVKYNDTLKGLVEAATAMPGNKEGYVARYMRDHLDNTILDAQGDFGVFKGLIFLWAMGYVPAAATQNLSQTPMVTFPYLAAKFGGFGIGDARASRAITKAMVQLKNFYKRGYYDNHTQFEMQALDYGIRTGRISETQAAELAGLAQGSNLLQGIGGNQVQRAWINFQEKGAWMFEMAEQWNRRIAYRAALDLAMKHPTMKVIDEAVSFAQDEHDALLTNFGPAEARAIVTANYVVEQTQFTYARWARPRMFRGKKSIVFVFKKYLQSLLFMLGSNKSDVLPRYLLVMLLLGGLGGLPGWEDTKDILKALGRWFRKDFDIERETRRFVLSWFDGKIDPDLVLHGFARRGLGLPAALDMLGSFATGTPGRGLAAPKHVRDPVTGELRPEGFARNIPFPVVDRSRALTSGQILPFSPGKLFTPSGDTNRNIAEETQKASGAVFSVGFNVYKAIMDKDLALTDRKRWEKAVPRELGAMSKMFRAFEEGRERSRGGPGGGSTIVGYDPNDTEQMMEKIAIGLGYQPLRVQARWDAIMAKVEVEKYYDMQRDALLAQLYEATTSKNDKARQDVVGAIKDFNTTLPEWARGRAITSETARKSVEGHMKAKVFREAGVPQQKGNVPIAREMDRLFPEATIDVRPSRD